jgi:hypothetical protein
MFSANRNISHSPPTNWVDYSADGAEAAANSNICYGSPAIDPGCMNLYLWDTGSGNTAVGHRRWLLYPQTQTFGTGDVPQSGPQANPYPAANALWVFDGNFGATRPATRDFYVAWPPPGYVPYQLVSPRWSFSYPNADFSTATVSMQRNGSAVPVRLEQVQNGYGENSIVWVPDNLDANAFFQPMPPAADTKSTVTISNVLVNGNAQTFQYSVTVFDPATPGTPYQFVAVVPCRLVDTRNANGPLGGPFLAANTSRTFPLLSSSCGIPSTAAAYSLNITAVPRTGFLGYTTIWPTGQSQPVTSTLNSFDGSILANAAIVPAGTSGSINTFSTNDTDLVIDIDGYFAPPGSGTLQFYPLTPCRVLDTRNANGTFGGPSLSSNSRSFPIASGPCGAPASASAYSLNLTVVPHGSLGYLTAWPAGQAQPVVSTLNSLDGSILANAAIVPAGSGGAVSFYAAGATDLVVDINGYFAPPGTGGLNFYPLPPCRVVDTRNGSGPLGGPILTAGTPRSFPLPSSGCGLPSTAAAYSLNYTVQPGGPLGFLSTWPTGQGQPLVSTLNDLKGLVIANAALVPAGTGGAINVLVTDSSHVIIDTNGYFGH